MSDLSGSGALNDREKENRIAQEEQKFDLQVDSLISNYGRDNFDLDSMGYYLKPETQWSVLSRHSSGEEAKRDFIELNDKVYLRLSLQNNT